MKIPQWLLDGENRKRLAYGSYGFTAVCAAAGMFFGARVFMSSTEIRELRKSIQAKQAEFTKQRSDLPTKPDQKSPSSLPSGLAVIEQFQSAAVSAARENAIKLEEFSASPTLAAYVSRYAGQVDAAGYSQVHVQMSLSGGLSQVLHMMQDLAKQSIPFQFAGIDFAPQPAPDAKTADLSRVSARIELEIITRGAPS